MAYDIGAKVSLEGEAEFRAAVKKIDDGLKTMRSELTAVTSEFIGQEKSEKALAAQNDVLSRRVQSLSEKLELQKKMLEESKKAGDDNAEATNKWQREVYNTTAELNRAKAAIAANTKAMDELGNETEDVAKQEAKAADKSVAASERRAAAYDAMASAAKAAGKIIAATVLAATVAVTGLVTASVNGYAEFEQLTGGVDTLFKGSADTVKKYANDAYKAAGMTANQYMETITGFSASLINSLSGDTAKAAELGNQAIIDMSDNANKLGTDITSIQNAYQGFAKQNYTMLDNLKLGYGGTKEEMERLLADAGKLAGTKFDISSFADIVEAIHVIQDSMGITGTTAAEASTTIQGSVNSMGAAWSNLVTGMADDSADLDQLITNLVESVGTVAENLLPKVQTALTSMGKVIAELAPQIAEALPQMIQNVLPSLLQAGADLVIGLATGITEALPGIIEAVADVVPTIITSLQEAGPQLLEAGGELLSMLAQGLLDGIDLLGDVGPEWGAKIGEGLEASIPDLLNHAIGFLFRLLSTLVDNAPKFAEAGASIIEGIVNGLDNWLPDLIAWIPYAITDFADGFADAWPQIMEIGAKIMTTLAGALIDAIPQLIMAIPDIRKAMLEAAVTIGGAIIEGAWNGFKAKISWLVEKVKEGFKAVVDAIKNLLGIHSPSTVFAGIGGNMASGLGKGWDKAFPAIQRDIEDAMAFDPMAKADWRRQIAQNMEMDLTQPVYAGRANSYAAAAAPRQDTQVAPAEFVFNITETIDGAVLARNQYHYNQDEAQRHGESYVQKGG